MFKSYTSNDNLLLPPYLGDFIPQMIQFGFVWGSVTKQELRDSAPVTYQDITPKKVEKALVQIDDTLNGGC